MSRHSAPGSDESTESYLSVLSDDSYLAELEPIVDDQFQEMLSHIRIIENNRKILKERKIQSHEVKKRDPNDTATPTSWADWPPEMKSDYDSYKAKVKTLEEAKKVQEASEKIARRSGNKDIATQEINRNKALNDSDKWIDAAIAAATARLGFMTKYPKAFTTLSNKGHITAVESILNSAKLAKRAIETQKQKIAKIKVTEAWKSGAAIGKK